jgi:hypothetical protein
VTFLSLDSIRDISVGQLPVLKSFQGQPSNYLRLLCDRNPSNTVEVGGGVIASDKSACCRAAFNLLGSSLIWSPPDIPS